MKRWPIFLLIPVVMVLLISGCSEDDATTPGETSTFKISGTLERMSVDGTTLIPWNLGTDKTIKLAVWNAAAGRHDILGSSPISVTGEFSIEPNANPLASTLEFPDFSGCNDENLTISDTTMKLAFLTLFIYLDTNEVGEVVCGYKSDLTSKEVGDCIVEYVYSSKNASATGTLICGNETQNMNVSLRAGYNVLVEKVTALTASSETIEVNNTIPANAKHIVLYYYGPSKPRTGPAYRPYAVFY